MLLGDLNINLDVPRNEQEAKVAAAMDHHGMACASKHFTVQRRKRCKLRGRWMWKHRRLPPGGGTWDRTDIQIEAGLLPNTMEGTEAAEEIQIHGAPYSLHQPQGTGRSNIHGGERGTESIPPEAGRMSP